MNIKSRAKTIFGKAAAVSGAYKRAFQSKMTVVTFHRVTDEIAEDGLTCSPAKFAKFCQFFGRHFTVVPLSEQIARCRVGAPLGGTLSITFDDGYRNNLEIAAPILKTYRLPATFFVSTGFIGTDHIPAWDMGLPVQQGWMTWDQVRALAGMGFEIGNHTDSHLDIGSADLDNVQAEFEVSSKKLLEALGRPARLFAYPFGGREHITEEARNLVKQFGFDCCVSSYGGLNGTNPDPYRVERVSIAGWFKTPDQFGFEFVAGKL